MNVLAQLLFSIIAQFAEEDIPILVHAITQRLVGNAVSPQGQALLQTAAAHVESVVNAPPAAPAVVAPVAPVEEPHAVQPE